MNTEKKLEKLEEKFEETVFRIDESQLKKITTCKKHKFIPYRENEVECVKCPTVLRYDPDKMELVDGELLIKK